MKLKVLRNEVFVSWVESALLKMEKLHFIIKLMKKDDNLKQYISSVLFMLGPVFTVPTKFNQF